MPNDICYGTYARFETLSRDEGAALMGANHLVGDIYSLELDLQEDRSYRIWLVNRFGAKVAFLAADQEQRVQTLRARQWTMRALLSFVAQNQKTQAYWGEVLLLCNDPHYDEAFNAFALNLRELMAEGVRPTVNFTEQAVLKIIETQGTWLPTGRVGAPEIDKGSTLIKAHQSTSDKLIEAGRKGNPGCYVITVLFWLVFALAVIAGGMKLLGMF